MSSKNVLVMVTPLSPPRLNGIARFARKAGWHLMTTDRLTHRLTGWNGDGVLVTLRNDSKQVNMVRALMRRHIPIVDLTCERPDIRLPRVIGDHREIGRLAARHFQERHFSSVVWFSTVHTNVHSLRIQGVQDVLGTDNVKLFIVSESLGARHHDNWNAISRWLGNELASEDKPLGVICYDDSDASRVADVCLQIELSVPEEVAILGIGDDRFICDYQQTPLSSVIHDAEETGYRGAEELQRLMDGGQASMEEKLIRPRGIAVRASTDVVAASHPVVRAALCDITENLSRSFGITQIAGDIGTTAITLHRLFKRHLGCRVGDEITRQRLARAKILLQTTDLTAKEISAQVGFCNLAHFSRTFRRKIGVTPRDFRRQRFQ